MKYRIGRTILATAVMGTCASLAFAAGDHKGKPGVGQGETSQQKSQQAIGVPGAGSSNVMLGETIIGKIVQIQGEEYSIQGEQGQNVKLRLTKDANIVCPGREGAKMSTGRENQSEQKEIPISPAAEQEMKSHDPAKSQEQSQALNDPNQQQAQNQMAAPREDPSNLKDVVGSTDEAANQDKARGSGFMVGGSGGCQFKVGDHVKVEASDIGTITTIKAMG